MCTINLVSSKAYFVSSFISGLNDELKLTAKMQQPKSVKEATEGARVQEMLVEALMKKQQFSFCSNQMAFNREGSKEAVKFGQNTKGNVVQPVTVGNLSFKGRFEIFEQRKQSGRCYKCGDWYVLEH